MILFLEGWAYLGSMHNPFREDPDYDADPEYCLGPRHNPWNVLDAPDYDLHLDPESIWPRTILCKGGFCGVSDHMLSAGGVQALVLYIIFINYN